jgi:predicted CXXCH cytochrome family protein
MKPQLFIALVLVSGFGFSIPGNSQISGTKHDFSGRSWAPAENRMCGVCHATHKAKNEPSAPLWNHQSTAVAAYTLYTSPTFDSQGGLTIMNPSASSKLCLSCHDGTVALENFGNITTGTAYIPTASRIGGVSGNDMSKEHPISFEYTDALATTDGGLRAPTTTNSGLGGSIAKDMLFANKMECATCHDVHNKYNVAHLLKMSNTNSQLCLTCHKK